MISKIPQIQKKTRLNRIELKRGLQIIPNIFTLGNAFFGFCSVIFASEGEFIAAAYCIFLGAMMDSLDGQIARLFRTTSNFGLQLDSLCDGISFCLAPAYLIYSWQLYKFGILGTLVCSILLMMGMLRLAKFNITASDQTHYFIGVPTPIVACFLATIVLNFDGSGIHLWGRILLSTLILFISSLMVSLIRVPTFKHVRKSWYAVTIAGFIATAIVFSFVKTLMIAFLAYFTFVLCKGIYIAMFRLVKKSTRDETLEDSKHNHNIA